METQLTQSNQTPLQSQAEQVTPPTPDPVVPAPLVTSAVSKEKTHYNASHTSYKLALFLGIITWVLTLLMLLLFLPTTYWFTWRGLVARFILQSAYIDAGDHVFTDNLYVVRQAKLAKPGYIALYEASEYESGLRDALALTSPLFSGSYQFLQLRVNPDKWIDRFSSSDTYGREFYVILYYFDNDILGVEDINTMSSSIALDSLGQPIIAKLTINKQ